MREVVWSISWPDYRHLYLSPSLVKLYGRSAQEFYNNPTLFKEATHPEDRQPIRVDGLTQDITERKHMEEKLYQTGSVTEVCFRDYLGDLLNSIFSAFTQQQIQIDKSIAAISIPTKTAISRGLIVNEIATNAIKHGFTAGQEAVFSLNIKKDRKREEYELTISNSGHPFPDHIEIESSCTLGLNLVTSLVAQLEGTIELQKKPAPVFTIRFPIED